MMDHVYELASFDRTTAHIHYKERLSKPISYWHSISTKKADAEAAARDLAEANKGKRRQPGEEAPTLSDEMKKQLYYRGEG
jgi:hypothetical protein